MPPPYGDAEFHAIAARYELQVLILGHAVLMMEGVRQKRDRLEADIATFVAEKAALQTEKAALQAEKKDLKERADRFRVKYPRR